jgi:DNA primase
MASDRSIVDQIKERIDPVDLISRYVSLKKSGKNYKGLCPFHPDRTPSFNVSREFGTWKCFGCGESGDVFTFIEKIENLTFREALERLAATAGIPYTSELDDERARERDRLRRACKAAAEFFRQALQESQPGLRYLERRGVTPESIEVFALGYAPPAADGLISALSERSIAPDDAVRAGILFMSPGDEGQPVYRAFFRNRIVFPLLNVHSEPIAFAGRSLGDEMPPYINSPETLLFSKSRTLYGLAQARQTIKEKNYAVLVEGNFDVITAHQAGLKNTVAALGTALTSGHLQTLSRHTQRVVLAYDADSAGVKAATRSSAMFEEAGFLTKIASLPPGKDPDTLIREDGADAFKAAVASAKGLTDYRLEQAANQCDFSTPEGRLRFARRALPILADIQDTVERDRFVRRVAELWRGPEGAAAADIAERDLREQVVRYKRRADRSRKAPDDDADLLGARPDRPTAAQLAEAAVLRSLFLDVGLARKIRSETEPEQFLTDEGAALARWAYERIDNGAAPDTDRAASELQGTAAGAYLSDVLMTPEPGEKYLMDCLQRLRFEAARARRQEQWERIAERVEDGTMGREDKEFEEYWRTSQETAGSNGS